MEDAKRDLRHAARLLRRNPLFTITAALSLAIATAADVHHAARVSYTRC
jgi:hypothetical protein